MFSRITHLALLLLLALPLAFMACGDDATGPGADPVSDFGGQWSITLTTLPAKGICDGTPGATSDWDAVVTQVGKSATITIGGLGVATLSIDGNKATGQTSSGAMYGFALEIADGQLGGTVTFTGNGCTEMYGVSGARTNNPPSTDFSGSWDITYTVASNDCSQGDPIGTTDDICRAITVSGNTVTIVEPDGNFIGIGDGNTASFEREGTEGTTEISLTVNGNSLSGTVTDRPAQGACTIVGTLSGTKRSQPCQDPTPGSFDGDWSVTITVATSQCTGEIPGSSVVACFEIATDGSSVTLDDGFDLITGTISGNSANFSRAAADGNLSLQLQVNNDSLSGSATYYYISGECPGATVQYSISGFRSESGCGGSASDEFAGSWEFDVDFNVNTCEASGNAGCEEFFQNGSLVQSADLGQGTVQGGTLTFYEYEETDWDLYENQITLQISNDGNSLTGTWETYYTSFGNPGDDCEINATLSATRVESCSAGQALKLVWPKPER